MRNPSVKQFSKAEAKEVLEFAKGERFYFGSVKDSLSDIARDKLYEHFLEVMPYGVAKSRTGDPDQWISEAFDRMGENLVIAWLDGRTEGGFTTEV